MLKKFIKKGRIPTVSIRNPKEINYKRIPQWCIERVKKIVSSLAEERKPRKREHRRTSIWKGWKQEQERNKQENGK